jgi:hypothetical protein
MLKSFADSRELQFAAVSFAMKQVNSVNEVLMNKSYVENTRLCLYTVCSIFLRSRGRCWRESRRDVREVWNCFYQLGALKKSKCTKDARGTAVCVCVSVPYGLHLWTSVQIACAYVPTVQGSGPSELCTGKVGAAAGLPSCLWTVRLVPLRRIW